MGPDGVYRHGFDEDVQHTTQNPCPDCRGRVYTNVREKVCEDWGLMFDKETNDSGSS